MSGAGTFSAGNGSPAGLDPVQPPSAVAIVPKPTQPPLFDISIRQFRRNSDGTLATIHWVDQAVALAMGIPAGGITSAPGIGNTLRKIKRAAGPRLQSDVKDAILVALGALIARNDITIVELTVLTPVPSQILIALTYVNMRLLPTQPTTLRSVV